MLLGARLVLPRLASGAEPDVEAEPLIRPGIELRRARDDQAGVREL